MPSPTTPTIPARADSTTLAKHFQPGEPAVIVKLVGVGNTAPFEFRDSKGSRTFVMRWDARAGGHQIRVPLSIWQANNAKIAHDFMDQRRMSHAVVVTFEVPIWTRSQIVDAFKQYVQSAERNEAGAAHFELMEIALNADLLSIVPEDTFPTEKGATDTASDALNVVGPGLAEPTVAPASKTSPAVIIAPAPLSGPGLTGNEPITDEAFRANMSLQTIEKPMHELAYDLVEQPKRIKALAALMGVDEAILRESTTSTASKVELVNPGWVRRKES